MAIKTECPVCGYPLEAYKGDEVSCPYCSSSLIAQDVSIPSPVIIGLVCFGLGILLGPTLIASTEEGSKWLARQVKTKLGG